MRPSGFSCRRCLDSLSASLRQRARSQTQTRWTSKTSRQSFARGAAIGVNKQPSSLIVPHRTASSLGTQTLQDEAGRPFVTSLGHASPESDRVLLQPDNLFHSFSHSPSPPIRRRAAFIKQHAYCPHPSHQRTRQPSAPGDPESRKSSTAEAAAAATTTTLAPTHVRFECPDCGIPVSCTEEHWADDYEAHLDVCDTLRQINEDDHDLRSGRFFPEFDYPGPQRAEEFVLNMSNWDTFLYTRDFKAVSYTHLTLPTIYSV